MVGLSEVAGQGVGRFSLGMRQRLGIAGALLGDPPTLLLDEPANGLDPEGILWVRNLLRYLAEQGRTVFVSSHLLAEMSLIADALVVIGRGRLIAACSVPGVHRPLRRRLRQRAQPRRRRAFAGLLRQRGATVETEADGALQVTGLEAPAIGELAAANARRPARAGAAVGVAGGGLPGGHPRGAGVRRRGSRWLTPSAASGSSCAPPGPTSCCCSSPWSCPCC